MEKTTRFYGVTRTPPFCPEIRSFIAESRKLQTLYSNCEGAYNYRVVKEEETDVLKEYIYNTIHYKEGQIWSSVTDKTIINKVESLQRAIMQISRRYHYNGETYFSAVWVYYFDYKQSSQMSTPLFKIPKETSGYEAVFLDIDLTEYESWDCYLDKVRFPNSFLCVPRHGQYFFDEGQGKLDLEYLSVSGTNIRLAKMTPYFLTAVRPLLLKLRTLMSQALDKVKRIIVWVWNFCEKNRWIDHLFSVVVSIMILYPPAAPFGHFVSRVSNLSFMLLNVIGHCGSLSGFLSTKSGSLGGASLSQPSNLDPQTSQMSDTWAQLKNISSGKQKNWPEILKLLFPLCAKFYLDIEAFIIPSDCPPFLRAIFNILSVVARKHLEWSDTNRPESPLLEEIKTDQIEENYSEKTKMQDVGNGLQKSDEAPWSSFHSFQKPTARCPVNISGIAKRTEQISPEKLLDFMETDSLKNKQISSDASMTSNPSLQIPDDGLILTATDSEIIFLMSNPSMHQVLDNLRRLLGSHYALETGADNGVFLATDESGKVVGNLYLPSKSVVIGYLCVDNTKAFKQVQILDEEEVEGENRAFHHE